MPLSKILSLNMYSTLPGYILVTAIGLVNSGYKQLAAIHASVIHTIMCNMLACISDPVIMDRDTLHTVCFVLDLWNQLGPLLVSNNMVLLW